MAEGNTSSGRSAGEGANNGRHRGQVPSEPSAGLHRRRVALASLVTGALVWGLIWYPYRVLRDAGIDGVAATTLTYLLALILALLFWRPRFKRPASPRLMLAMALAAGGCNLGYVMAMLSGEVMRVLLLFYLAPLWTVLLSRLILGERLNRFGAFVVLLSLAGAATMLWRPEAGLPLPRDIADWLGLGAGFSFALYNVLSRRARDVPVRQRVLASFAGVIALGLLLDLAFDASGLPALAAAPAGAWLLLLLTGGILLAVNLVVQFGLANTPANQAIVIMLSEVGFAAVSSWLLAGELIGLQDWAGGAMILAASVFTARMES